MICQRLLQPTGRFRKRLLSLDVSPLNCAMAANAQDIDISTLKGFDQVAAVIAGRPLFHFNVVNSFCYFRRREDDLSNRWPDIELVMEELESPQGQIGIRFCEVADVEFSGFGQIIGLFFQSIQDRGWERLRFEVGDYEDGRIHLFCREITLFDPRMSPDQDAASS